MGTPSTGRIRPPLDSFFAVRFSQAEAERLRTLADSTDQPVARLIRQATRRYLAEVARDE